MYKNVSGQTIVEAMVAISIALVGLLGVLALVSASLAFTNDASQKFVATYLAAEGIEIVKNIIDTNVANGAIWNTDVNDGLYKTSAADPILRQTTGTKLKLPPDGGEYQYDNGNPTPYTRTIQIINDTDSVTVIAKVSWNARAKDQSVEVRDIFKRWR
ncbi:MAG: hypothetical protein Q7R98_03640 [Candidatus Jorgensenbacteria bacterium]|nr:hypothetical protein [Candidatus Jorgensenbacteria bacterium]